MNLSLYKSFFLSAILFAGLIHPLGANPFKEAEVVFVAGKVVIGTPPAKPTKEAGVGMRILSGNYLKTGKKSSSELKFNDNTLARIGANSIFSFKKDAREIEFLQGEGLFQFPKGKGGTQIKTPALTAAIVGTTIYLKINKDTVEYLCLEGLCDVGPYRMQPGDKLVVKGRAAAYNPPLEKFDIMDFVQKNNLFTGFSKPLPSLPLIEDAARKQK